AAHDARRQAEEAAIARARAGLESAVAAVAGHDRLVHERRAVLDALRSQCLQHEVGLAEKRLRVEHLEQNIRERYGAELTSQPPSASPEVEADGLARLEVLREKLARIGEVNVGAIDELRELEDRAQFLRAQKDDLERSLTDLDRTIQRLNRASRTKFAETFA